MTEFLILLVGFGVLLKGADFFVDGSSSISLKLHISPLIVGLTLVAFGTSAPELVVNILASSQGANSLAFGNIMGSNIANIALVVGISAVFIPLAVHSVVVTREIPFMILSSLVLITLVFDRFFQGSSNNILPRSDGLILIFFFAIFIYYLFSNVLKDREERASVKKEIRKDNIIKTKYLPNWKTSLFFFGGMAMIVVGSQLVVNSGIKLAALFNVSEGFVGLTLIALGTSLPELVTSITAIIKKETDIAVGNIVGSNIFNVFFVLGITALISPLSFDTDLAQEMVLMVGIFVLFFIFSLNGKKINRLEGGALLFLYFLYLSFIFYSEFF